jgi:hypothetical protein
MVRWVRSRCISLSSTSSRNASLQNGIACTSIAKRWQETGALKETTIALGTVLLLDCVVQPIIEFNEPSAQIIKSSRRESA